MSDLIINHVYCSSPKISLKEARALGLKVYWTGKQCPNGHTDYRYTKKSECCTCVRLKAAATTYKKLRTGTAINLEARSKAEDLLEQIRLEKELDDF